MTSDLYSVVLLALVAGCFVIVGLAAWGGIERWGRNR